MMRKFFNTINDIKKQGIVHPCRLCNHLCSNIKRWISEHLYGILGTVIVHLILAISFMIFKISTLPVHHQQSVVISFEQEPSPELPLKENKADKIVPDKELKKWIHDIPVNEALKKKGNFDINKYIDQVKKEMIRSGQLTKDNYIDEQKQKQEEMAKELSSKLPLKTGKNPGDSLTATEIMASHYSGPTRVKYYLTGRIARNLVIPIYKCEGSGIVVVSIIVNQEGNVTDVSIETDKSATPICMHETALQAARSSYFDVDPNAPEKQQGTITYYFVAQDE